MTNLESKQEMLNKMHNFFNKEVVPILPEYNAKRRKDRLILISVYILLAGIFLMFISEYFLILTVIAVLLLCVIQNGSGEKTTVIEGDYEISLKRQLMPKFLSIFGEYQWNKYMLNNPQKAKDLNLFLKNLKIFPNSLFILPDDVIQGHCGNVGVEVIELRTGIYANGVIAVILLAILGMILAVPVCFILGIVLIIIMSFGNTTVILSYLGILAALIVIGIPIFLIRNAVVNQSMRGVLLKYTFPKQFSEHTFLFENKISSQKLIHKGRKGFQKVSLEDVNFIKDYTVFSTDQVEARYLLTTSFMERFKNIENAFHPVFQRAEFKDNELCILIGTKRDLFKMGSMNEETTFSHFYNLFNEFYSVIDMIEQLKLDQKIGL